MKRLYKILFIGALIGFFSCADEELEPIVTFDNIGKGAYVRLINLTGGVFDLANLSSSQVAFDVDFVDIEDGALVTNYDVYIEFKDKTPANGDNSKARQLFRGFTTSDFTTSEKGNPGVSVTITANDAMSTLGLSAGDLSSDDEFIYNGEVITSTGSVHNWQNSSAPVRGSAFQGHFRMTIPVSCPLGDSQFAGSYKMAYVGDAPGGPFGDAFGATPGVITFSVVTPTRRTAKFDYLPDDFAFGTSMVLDFKCDKIEMPDIDSGAGCGDGTIIIGQGPITPFDLNDDSYFEVTFEEFKKDGGCGVATPISFTLGFTKQ